MTTALVLNNFHQFDVEDVADFAKGPRALIGHAVAGIDTILDNLRVVAEKTKNFPQNAQALMGRVNTEAHIILSKIRVVLGSIQDAAGFSQKFHTSLERVNEDFESLAKQVESLETPIEGLITGFEIGTLVERVEEWSNLGAEGLKTIAQPIQIITLIADVKKVANTIFGTIEKGKEALKTLEITILGFSIVARFCSTLSWMQKLGIITHAIAHAGCLSLIGSLSNLIMASVDLGNNVVHFTSTLKLLKTFLNFTIAVLGVFLISYISSQLHLLLLILMGVTLLLSVATKTHEV
jgi:hypothetical protein